MTKKISLEELLAMIQNNASSNTDNGEDQRTIGIFPTDDKTKAAMNRHISAVNAMKQKARRLKEKIAQVVASQTELYEAFYRASGGGMNEGDEQYVAFMKRRDDLNAQQYALEDQVIKLQGEELLLHRRWRRDIQQAMASIPEAVDPLGYNGFVFNENYTQVKVVACEGCKHPKYYMGEEAYLKAHPPVHAGWVEEVIAKLRAGQDIEDVLVIEGEPVEEDHPKGDPAHGTLDDDNVGNDF